MAPRRTSVGCVVLLKPLFYPTTEKRNSANFAFWGFSEVELPLYGVLRSSSTGLNTTSMVRVSPAYSAHTTTSVSSPFLKGLGSGTAGGTWASSQTTAVRFLPGATERRSDATLAKVLAVWVAFFRSVSRYVRSMNVVPWTRSRCVLHGLTVQRGPSEPS